jgi:hypothetical protein
MMFSFSDIGNEYAENIINSLTAMQGLCFLCLLHNESGKAGCVIV